MTWEELKEKAKGLGYYEVYDDGDIPYFDGDGSYLLVNRNSKNNIHFVKDGTIEDGYCCVISENRTYEQMHQIMLALQ